MPKKHSLNAKEVSFEVLKAKNPYSPLWINKKITNIVANARKSFLRYGDVPIFDAYDTKSAVYIASCKYQNRVEWLSVRFIPGDGNPSGTADLKECLLNGRPLKSNTRSRFNNDIDLATKSISLSKICGFSSVSASNSNRRNEISYNSLNYTLHLFTLINNKFFEDIAKQDKTFTHITGLFRDELIKNSLSFIMDKSSFPRFTSPRDVFNTPEMTFRLNRSASAYKFPTYFLNMTDVGKVFESLMRLNHISRSTLKHYLGREKDTFLLYIQPNNLRESIYLKNLGKLLATKGKLFNSQMTGEKLRDILDKNVRDGAKLKIMKLEFWRNDIQKINRALLK